MVIVGSRGLGKLKGILLGSTSHYLVQKSSVPIMVRGVAYTGGLVLMTCRWLAVGYRGHYARQTHLTCDILPESVWHPQVLRKRRAASKKMISWMWPRRRRAGLLKARMMVEDKRHSWGRDISV